MIPPIRKFEFAAFYFDVSAERPHWRARTGAAAICWWKLSVFQNNFKIERKYVKIAIQSFNWRLEPENTRIRWNNGSPFIEPSTVSFRDFAPFFLGPVETSISLDH